MTLPLRGEIWDVDFPEAGIHPAVVLTRNELMLRLGSWTVALITHTVGPGATHVAVGENEGLADDSYVNASDIHTLRRSRFGRRRGALSYEKLREVNRVVTAVLDLDFPPP